MNGKDLRKKILESGFKIADIASGMGITEEHLYSKLRAQDVKVSLVVQLCKATNTSIGKWIELPSNDAHSNSNSNPDYRDKYIECLEENRLLQKEISSLKDRLNVFQNDNTKPAKSKLKES